MSGSILYRNVKGNRVISALRINGREESLKYWSRIAGKTRHELLERLKFMSPYDAVYDGTMPYTPSKLWPVPESVLRNEYESRT